MHRPHCRDVEPDPPAHCCPHLSGPTCCVDLGGQAARSRRGALIVNLLLSAGVLYLLWPYLLPEISEVLSLSETDIFDYKNWIVSLPELAVLVFALLAIARERVPAAQTPANRPRSFPFCTEGAASASAEIPTGSGQIALVRTAGALSNVGEIRRIPEVAVDRRKLDLARRRKPACGIDDAGPYRRRDAGAADNAPTVAVGDVIDPDAGIGVRVGGDVGCSPLAADNSGNRRLVGWARLVLARAAAGR